MYNYKYFPPTFKCLSICLIISHKSHALCELPVNGPITLIYM